MKKTAWTASDVAGEVAISVVADVGIAGLFGAIGLGSGGAIGVAGAAAAIFTGPVGLVLISAGVVYAVYSATRQADNNVRDLISRIEALDYESTEAKPIVSHWIENLEQYCDIFDIPIGTTNKAQTAKAAGNRVEKLMGLQADMKLMSNAWPKVKTALKDWGTDPSDFEYAFRRTYARLSKIIQNVNAESKKAAVALLKKNPQTIDPLMTEILSLTTQITSTWAAPEFTTEERATIGIGRKMLMKQDVDMKQIQATIPKLNILRNDLKALLQEAKKRRRKRAKTENELKKQAVGLPDIPTVDVSAPTTPTTPRVTKRRMVKNLAVEKLQFLLNRFSVAKDIKNEQLIPDGMYGPRTAKSLSVVMSSSPDVQAKFKRWGFTPQLALDVRLVSKYPGFITFAIKTLSEELTPEAELAPKPQPVAPKVTQTGIACNMSKANPKPEDILACLQTIFIYKGGSLIAAYDYMRSVGMDDNSMIRTILNLFGGAKPIDWSADTIERALGTRYGP